jgi:DNA-binding transcriptional ArsR family regulator
MNSEHRHDEVSAMRATAHPVRLQILSLLTGAAMSAAELARELGTTHANASYHLRQLAAAGLVVEAGEETIRGGVANRYRHPWDAADRAEKGGSARGATATPEDRTAYVRAMGTELVRRFAARAPRTRSLLADAELWVEPDVWERVRGLVTEAAGLLHAQARPPHSEGSLHVNLTAAAFVMDESTRTGS